MFESGTGHDGVIGRGLTFPLDKKEKTKKPSKMDKACEGMFLDTRWQSVQDCDLRKKEKKPTREAYPEAVSRLWCKAGIRRESKQNMAIWVEKSKTMVQNAKATSIFRAKYQNGGSYKWEDSGKLQKGPTEYLAEY